MNKKNEEVMVPVTEATTDVATQSDLNLDLCDVNTGGVSKIPFMKVPRGQGNGGKGFRVGDTVIIPSNSGKKVTMIPVGVYWSGVAKYNMVKDPNTGRFTGFRYRSQEEALEKGPADLAKVGCSDPVTFAGPNGKWPNNQAPTFVDCIELKCLVESEDGYAKVGDKFFAPVIITCWKREMVVAAVLKEKLQVLRSRGPAELMQMECELSAFEFKDNEWLQVSVKAVHDLDSDWMHDLQAICL